MHANDVYTTVFPGTSVSRAYGRSRAHLGCGVRTVGRPVAKAEPVCPAHESVRLLARERRNSHENSGIFARTSCASVVPMPRARPTYSSRKLGRLADEGRGKVYAVAYQLERQSGATAGAMLPDSTSILGCGHTGTKRTLKACPSVTGMDFCQQASRSGLRIERNAQIYIL